ncbi:MAG: hypothetical protein BroJett033_5650 [Chloroflexota bacterium]|nr:MAG: hypothetical protein BroJett033_5650 [Chloroflexota bacterium]
MNKLQNELNPPEAADNWKAKTYGIGAVGGALFGLLASYLYARAADEGAHRNAGKPPAIPTVTLIAVLLSGLGLIRQIAEAGRPKN